MNNFLKRLELQGFKSFAQKTVLEFPGRVVAIVGPNGSGKSNVIDALKWILGEREAKELRGETLEHLIFAGTPKRPAAGFAKVSLYFDNRSKFFPTDVEEVVLERKIDRTGTSSFRLNDAEVRLKDLLPMLARTRLGTRGITMVSQGESDIFVKCTPEERRVMIEEVLGLREFRLKKTQAERRLTTSRLNMEKVEAMIEELTPHLRLLRRQKHRWERRSEIEKSLRECEDRYFSFRFHHLVNAREITTAPLRSLQEEREKKVRAISVLEGMLKGIETDTGAAEEIKRIRREIEKLLEEKSSVDREYARLEARMEFARTAPKRERSIQEFIASLKSFLEEVNALVALEDFTEVKRRLKALAERMRNFVEGKIDKTEGTEETNAELERWRLRALTITETLQKFRVEEEAMLAQRDEATREFRTLLEHIEREKNELRHIDEELQKYHFERERNELRIQELEREWQSIGRAVGELRNLPKFQETIDEREEERKMAKWRSELAAIGEIDTALVKEAEDAETRYSFLTRELEDLRKASHDLRRLVRELEEKIHRDFKEAFRAINNALNEYFRLMFGGGKAKLRMKIPSPQPHLPSENGNGDLTEETQLQETPNEEETRDPELNAGVEIELALPRKRITSLDMLSGGEKSLVSLAALFALISVSPPPFLVLDEIDAALDDENARRFSELIKNFSHKTQFVVVTHNRATMEAADILYGVTMGDEGVSKLLSLKLEP